MSDTNPNNISELAAAFSEFRGEMRAEVKHIGHDVKNINAKLDAYPTHRDLKAVETRVSVLESAQRKAAWAIITAWLGGLGTVGALIAKKI